ncbi:MAG: hypothetical protein GY822_19540 [Deltaproteobacteria bacterium]|nr:hypothetical protein [Deltaproteobacteria bacterium]
MSKNAPGAFAKTSTPGLLFHAAQQLSAEPANVRAVNLPEWVPASFNLQKAAQTAKSILVAQGADPATVGPGLVKSILFTDADHTLIKTTNPVLLKNEKTGELLHHPKTGRVITLRGQGYREELDELKKEFPKLPWDDLAFDYSGMSDANEVHQGASNKPWTPSPTTKLIPTHAISLLRRVLQAIFRRCFTSI